MSSLVKQHNMNYGKIICKAELVDCIYMTDEFINKLKKDNIVLIKGKLEINSDRKDTFLADEIIVLKENI